MSTMRQTAAGHAGIMRQVVLRAYARGLPRAEDFAVETVPIPEAGPGEVLLRTVLLSLDPLIRFPIDETLLTGRTQVALGEPMYGGTVSEVVASRHPDYPVGAYVEGRSGWREYAALKPESLAFGLRIVDPALAPLSTALGVLGMPGQTAHACVVGIGRVRAGETVAISAAAGAVGTIAGQIAKLLGARVVGIAGGPAKCAAIEAIGFDAAVDYKAPDFADQLAAAVPDGIDCYVENVGGDVMFAVLPHLKYRARMPVCGFIAYYGAGREGPGPDRMPGFLRMVMSKGLELRGFGGQMVAGPAALDELTAWVREGKLRHPEAVVDGLENAPAAFAGIFAGNGNVGKLLVRVGRD